MSHQLSRHRAHRDACWQIDWNFENVCSGGIDGTIKSFKINVDTGALTEIVSIDAFPLGVVSLINLNGYLLAASSMDGNIKIIDLKLGKPIRSLRAGSGDCWSLSATNEEIVSGSASGAINFWNINMGNHVNAIETNGSFILSVVVFPEKYLAVGHRDGVIRLYSYSNSNDIAVPIENTTTTTSTSVGNFATSNPIVLNGHAMPVRDLCFSVDGNFLYSASDDKTCQCFSTAGGEIIGTLRGHTSWVTSVHVSKKHVVTGSSDRSVKLWDIETRECLSTFDVGLAGEVWAVAFSPDGLKLAAGTSSGDIITYAVVGGR
jgi:WD repeat-containing protein 61